MLSGTAKTGLALLLSALAFEACSTPAEKSTGTNWITCKTDADCESRPRTRCSEDKRCEPVEGTPDASSGGDGGATGSGGIAGIAGKAFGTAGKAFGTGGAGGGSIGGARGSIGGDDGAGGSLETGGQATGGQGGGDAGGEPVHVEGCYSPGQNIETSFVVGAFGCKCIESQTPDGLCLQVPTVTSEVFAYLCENGHWKADIDNTACTGCWTPDQPEFANARPNNGCACVNENETACIVTQNEGYTNAVCRGGKWKLDPTLSSCACTKDARCGFGGKCVGQTCTPRVCEADGVRYAVGVSFPSPSDDCNTCECDTPGHLTCTTKECGQTACPTGTVQARACVGCGLSGGCGLWRFGCLPRCERDADCARTGTPVCDPTDHVCSAGGCL